MLIIGKILPIILNIITDNGKNAKYHLAWTVLGIFCQQMICFRIYAILSVACRQPIDEKGELVVVKVSAKEHCSRVHCHLSENLSYINSSVIAFMFV